jgi:hypothetical protein
VAAHDRTEAQSVEIATVVLLVLLVFLVPVLGWVFFVLLGVILLAVLWPRKRR